MEYISYTIDKKSPIIYTDYCGNVIYENGVLSRILVDGGYITMNSTTATYHYYIQDHQGNNRVVFNQNGTIEQTNHYYPFVITFCEGIDNSDNRYKYNGKELIEFMDWICIIMEPDITTRQLEDGK